MNNACRVIRAFLVLFLLGSDFAQAQQIAYKAYGLNFSPYLDGQDPNQNLPISSAQIQQRMTIIRPYTNWIRTFGCLNGLGQAGQIAHAMGLKAAIGIWISKNSTANAQEIACAVAVANGGNADLVIVGTEALLRNDISEQQLLSYMQAVRQQVPATVPVTTADVYSALLAHPAVVQASSIVMANFYPYWEGTSVDSAISAIDAAYNRLVAAADGKSVAVAETGWPSGGNTIGGAIPSPANAASYFLRFVTWARAKDVPYFYFESFDETWKAQYEGPQGSSWGIWDKFGTLKPGMKTVFDGQTIPVSTPGTCRGSGAPSIDIVFAGPIGDARPVHGVVAHVTPADYKIAAYILVGSGWWTKPYFNQPLTTIQSDCTFVAAIATGGLDTQATRVRAFLVPNGYAPPLAAGGASLPAELSQNAVASVEVTRGASGLCGTVSSSGSGLPGVIVSLSGSAMLTAQTVSNGQYCFSNLASGGTYTVAPSKPNYMILPSSRTVTLTSGSNTLDFTASARPDVISLSPVSGSGISGLYTAVFRHGGGPSKHYLGYMLFLPTPNIVWFTAKGSCLLEYNRISNGMRLINDAGTGWSEPPQGVPVSPETAPLSNSACTINVAGASATFSGNDMTVTAPVTFRAPRMTPVLGTFLQELDVDGQWTDMRQFGNWVIPGAVASPGPAVVTISPSQSTGLNVTLTATASHSSSVGQIGMFHMLIADRIVSGAPCQVVYFAFDNTVALINDAGTNFAGAGRVALGTANVLTNSRCSLNVAGTMRSVTGNTVSVSYPMTFTPGTFGGLKNLYLNTFDLSGNLSHWVQGGVLTVQ